MVWTVSQPPLKVGRGVRFRVPVKEWRFIYRHRADGSRGCGYWWCVFRVRPLLLVCGVLVEFRHRCYERLRVRANGRVNRNLTDVLRECFRLCELVNDVRRSRRTVATYYPVG